MQKAVYVVFAIAFIGAILAWSPWRQINVAPTPTASSTPIVTTPSSTPPHVTPIIISLPSKPVKGDITLKIGQKAEQKDGAANFSLTLDGITQDSRCPVNVTCIQAGAVTAQVTLKDALHTEKHDIISNATPYVFGEYHIALINVLPVPYSGTSIAKKDYRLTFHVDKNVPILEKKATNTITP